MSYDNIKRKNDTLIPNADYNEKRLHRPTRIWLYGMILVPILLIGNVMLPYIFVVYLAYSTPLELAFYFIGIPLLIELATRLSSRFVSSRKTLASYSNRVQLSIFVSSVLLLVSGNLLWMFIH